MLIESAIAPALRIRCRDVGRMILSLAVSFQPAASALKHHNLLRPWRMMANYGFKRTAGTHHRVS